MATNNSKATQGTPNVPLLWVDKYKPQSISQMCYPSVANKLKLWVEGFDPKNPKRARGVLLSGPPGIGKTTTVYMVAKELHMQVIEYNASNFRSKKSLRQNVSDVTRSSRIFGSPASKSDGLRKAAPTLLAAPGSSNAPPAAFILLMDEVDGCDIGGVGEVIDMLKHTTAPIICTCNDRWHPKLRSLVNHVEDMHYNRPPCNIVANYVCDRILAKEGIALPKQVLQDIIKQSGSDIRSTLNNLQLWCMNRSVLNQQTLSVDAAKSYKNADSGLFDSAEKFLFQGKSTGPGIQSLENLFSTYYNSDLIDLFVQENYLHFRPDNKDYLACVANAAECISQADGFQRVMYMEQNWSVSNAYILLSSIMPCALTRGHYESFATGQAVFFDRQRPVKFPTWLGNNSTANKNVRLARVLAAQVCHPGIGASGHQEDMVLDYAPLGWERVLSHPLAESGKDGIPTVTKVMDQYHLQRDDWDFIQQISRFAKMGSTRGQPGATHPVEIPTAIKSAFTREFNKSHKMESVTKSALTKGKVLDLTTTAAPVGADAESSETEEMEDVSSSLKSAGVIVSGVPKKPPAKRSSKAANPAPKRAPPAKRTPVAKKATAKGKRKRALSDTESDSE